MIARPENLPDYETPPLDEVVLGVQFVPINGYTSVMSKDVWGLFNKNYPKIEEHPPLSPTFETFGGGTHQQNVNVQFGGLPPANRLWFVSEFQDHLLQFQHDRFLLNWRSIPQKKSYPRFEVIAASFEDSLAKLDRLFESELKEKVSITQAEISYINIIRVEDFSKSGDWIKLLELNNFQPESLNLQLAEVIKDENDKPYARLFHEFQSVMSKDMKVKAIKMSLIFRGKPSSKEITDTMEFLKLGREAIVNRFTELTTSSAHLNWKRKQ